MAKLHEVVTNNEVQEGKEVQAFDLDIHNVFVIGHSIGGYLALWSCIDSNVEKLPFTPTACLALAPVGDLIQAEKRK